MLHIHKVSHRDIMLGMYARLFRQWRVIVSHDTRGIMNYLQIPPQDVRTKSRALNEMEPRDTRDTALPVNIAMSRPAGDQLVMFHVTDSSCILGPILLT